MRVPILRLGDVLLTSIQEDLTDQEAVDFQGDVLQKVRDTGSSGLVIDITALDVVDSFMARVINETANMVRLLGTEIVLSGMQPSVALTLIEMGRELLGVKTALNLEMGLETVRNLIEKRKMV